MYSQCGTVAERGWDTADSSAGMWYGFPRTHCSVFHAPSDVSCGS